MGQLCAQLPAPHPRGGRREAKLRPQHSPCTPLLSLQARLGSSPGDKATPRVQGRTPWPCLSLVAVSLLSLASRPTLVHPEVSVTPQLLGSSLSYPPAPLNPFHPLGAQPAPRECRGPGRVGSDTGVAVGWGQHRHPQQQWASRHLPGPLAHAWGSVLSLAPPALLLAPHIQGVAALCHQFLYIVHGLGLAHVAKLGDDLVEGVLHVPGHVPGIAANTE